MHEVRDPELSQSSSSVKPVLVAAGAVVGLLLLVCGGAAGYVALMVPPRDEEPVANPPMAPTANEHFQMMQKRFATIEIPFTRDPAVVRKVAATIVDIDLPAEFEPIEAKRNTTKRWAVFGKKSENAAVLKLAGIYLEIADIIPGAPADNEMRRQVLEMAATDTGRNDTTLKRTREKMKSAERELTVLGRSAVFEFSQGKRDSDKKPVWRIAGAFRTDTGMAALVYLVPESEFDEEAVVRMIESLRPAPDEDADADEPSAPRKPIPGNSIPDKPETARPETGIPDTASDKAAKHD